MEVAMTSRICSVWMLTLLAAVATCLTATAALTQTLSGDGLVKALRQGGYVIVMSFAVDGKQYVAIAAGSALFVFGL